MGGFLQTAANVEPFGRRVKHPGARTFDGFAQKQRYPQAGLRFSFPSGFIGFFHLPQVQGELSYIWISIHVNNGEPLQISTVILEIKNETDYCLEPSVP
ncbi:hypothetical protein [Comamonas endophytica]|uniref:Uncharacterized protein n=1 Tax=Comamonas endophytica TaxID=2949090 RepID=A0ABY6GH12_9BURK|nr:MULTISPECIES: hypothetical protein [unclassified Acidovorax]MCD2513426.1 hypothetical protein [Acidovorax sp. D4N7]UYG53792.1 hypothetical protein M9799_17815 [Acidovorax sp. 5MLIR]